MKKQNNSLLKIILIIYIRWMNQMELFLFYIWERYTLEETQINQQLLTRKMKLYTEMCMVLLVDIQTYENHKRYIH